MHFFADPGAVTDTLRQQAREIADTVAAAATHGGAEHGGKFEFTVLLEHMQDSHEIQTPFGHWALPHLAPINVAGLTLDLSPTKHAFFLVLAALILCVMAISSARKYRKTLVPSGFASALESVIIFMRDEVVIPNMGKAGLQYLPYLLTVFFFIVLMNLMGLFPYGATSTSNIAVTAGMAVISFVMIQVSAIRSQGLKHYLAHLTGGTPWFLWPIMIPVEIVGLFTKPFALCIRLFANMTGGHLSLLSLLSLIFLFQTLVIAPIPVLFVVGVNMLELFVAFLQAYIFTMLTSLFMGLGIQSGHEESHHAGS
ncbi:MAG: F0F1 ATP synthase subunit A [Bacteroidota bacterium]